MAFDDLVRLLEDLRTDVTTGVWVPTESERRLAGMVVATANELEQPEDPAVPSVITRALRESLRAAGPKVAPPDGERRWATAAVHCAMALEPQRVADSPEGRELARLLLSLCPVVEGSVPS
ncbi:hypothetical protein AB0J38_01745 [Streptomyces sp. NPDC050095]|uniref:hypothetical protein n=1 Tax=unclassified Streptomyces TaxID=2593676 RepID=UPI0034445986